MFQGRVRVLALIVKLFSISSSVASVVYNSNLLSLLVEEVRNVNDMLITLSVLELLYEVWHQPLFQYNLSLSTSYCIFYVPMPFFAKSSSHITMSITNSYEKAVSSLYMVVSLSSGLLICFIYNATRVCLTCSFFFSFFVVVVVGMMKLAEIPHGTEFLSRTILLQLLSSIIRSAYDKIITSPLHVFTFFF